MSPGTSIPLCLLAASVIAASAPAAVAADLPEAAPGSEGFAADLGGKVDAVLGRYENVHGVVILHDGKIVLERYLTGNDERMGWPVEGVTFGPDVLHDVRSITKSVIGLLYGIALAEGKVPPLDAPLVDSFPEYADLATPELRRITIEDALTMRLGLSWREDGPQPTTEIEMLHQADRYRFTLSQPIVLKPGTVFNYNGGGTTLLSRVIAHGTGMSVADYGTEKLFAPLGIDDFEWVVDYFGVPYGHGGLRFRPRDLAKLGQLILNDGIWDGRQIVPADWLAASFKRGISTGWRGCFYGYQWWLCYAGANDEFPVIEAMGLGGNELLVVPQYDLVLAVTRGEYQYGDAWLAAWAILEEAAIPSLPGR
jgi:CubicO group peptidase (beta-lactamase class C family)